MVRDSGGGEVVVPPTIQALLAARLDQLDPAERAVLERGAVEGQLFHRGAVEALAPDDGAGRRSDSWRSCARSSCVPTARSSRRGRLPLPPPADPRRRLRRAPQGRACRPARALRRLARRARRRPGRARRDRRLPPRAGVPLPARAGARRPVGELALAARWRLLAAGRHARVRDDFTAAVNLWERAAQVAPNGPLEIQLEFAHADALFEVGRAAMRSTSPMHWPSGARTRATASPS